MGGGSKIPYPKHVWSPAGGWYAQPGNWKANTFVAGSFIFGFVLMTWTFSASREQWSRKPQPEQWAPSRHWSKQLKQWGREDKAQSSDKTQE